MIPLRLATQVLTAGPAVRAAVDDPGGRSASAVVVVLAIAGALIGALVVAEVFAAVVRAIGRRTWLADNLSRRARRPLRLVLVVAAVWVAIRLTTEPPPVGAPWLPALEHVLLIGLIVAIAWLVGALAFVAEDAALARYRTDVPDNRHARRVRTQVMILRRLTVAVLVLVAVAAVLLTFEGARTAGAGVLASAGLLSVVAGLAAQSSLANVFAGLQLAFTDAIRVDDVVVVQDEWGRIEEITLTYVVVHVWDDRRLILPSTYFTTTPFENWTRRAADLLGTVELDLDWAVPVQPMREELTRLLNASGLWDHRVGVLQVTEATAGYVRVRALASAADAPTLFDLRCEVREGLVAWLQREHPEALPRTRWEQTASAAAAVQRPDDVPVQRPDDAAVPARGQADGGEETVLLDEGKDSRLFTGSLRAVERSKAFTGPGLEVIAEREETAHRAQTPEPAPRRETQVTRRPAAQAQPAPVAAAPEPESPPTAAGRTAPPPPGDLAPALPDEPAPLTRQALRRQDATTPTPPPPAPDLAPGPAADPLRDEATQRLPRQPGPDAE